MRTQIAIIGGGPAGLLLSQLLHREGIANVVLEKHSRFHVEGRIRAGVLEPGTVELLERAGAARRLHQEALQHDGFALAFGERSLRIDLKALAGASVTVYGQTEIAKDLNDLCLTREGSLVFKAQDAALHDFDTAHPSVSYRKDGIAHTLTCDFIAGCDGFHGIARASVPRMAINTFERVLPFGWLGILSETPPVSDELIYARSARGFALCSMRSRTLSRYYLQCAIADQIAEWPDARFWDELRWRIPQAAAQRLVAGPSQEKSIAPLRSFVAEPMRFGRLFLAGDAAHIVPPTGAKGLNLAAADAGALARAFAAHYRDGDASGLDSYSEKSLRRVWSAVRFSWWFTGLTHRIGDEFDGRLQEAEFDAIADSGAAAATLAEHYAGKFNPPGSASLPRAR